MAKISDGAIVGSAIVRIIEKYGKDCVPKVYEFASELKNSVLKSN
jgi:tryptophan synthase alpha chain